MVTLRELWRLNMNGLLVKRVEGRFSYTRTEYRFDRYLMRTVLALAMLILLGAFVYGMHSGVKLHELYLTCPVTETAGCLNPYYENCDEEYCQSIVFRERFNPGEVVGRQAPESFARLEYWAVFLAVGLCIGALILNHWLYNRGKMPIEIEVEP